MRWFRVSKGLETDYEGTEVPLVVRVLSSEGYGEAAVKDQIEEGPVDNHEKVFPEIVVVRDVLPVAELRTNLLSHRPIGVVVVV